MDISKFKMLNSSLKSESNQFEPFGVATSPAAKISQGKQLTGNLRIIRDSVADLHACIQRWNELLLKGTTIIKQIISTDVESHDLSDDKLTASCDQLESIIDAFDDLVLSMKNIFKYMQSIEKLHVEKGHLFLTWPAEKFAKCSRSIYEAYEKEAVAKRIIFESVAHLNGKEEEIIYLAAWSHQIYVPSHLNTNLEYMIVETGLRNK